MSDPVVRLVPDPPEPPEVPGAAEVVRRRLDGTYDLDPWGLDPDAARLAGRLAAVRWRVTLSGVEHLPVDGPALLIANRRLGWSEPAVVTSSVTRATGRIVRPVGGIDVDPIGGLLRRVGALPARPDEVAAALRADNLVLVPTRREPLRNRPGQLPIELVAPAVAAGVPLVPVAVTGWEPGWRWNIRIGPPVVPSAPTKGRVGARSQARAVGLAAVEVASALDAMLADAFGRGLGGLLRSLVPGQRRRHGVVSAEGT